MGDLWRKAFRSSAQGSPQRKTRAELPHKEQGSGQGLRFINSGHFGVDVMKKKDKESKLFRTYTPSNDHPHQIFVASYSGRE